jgi:D-proline reductase (dithiol) PrdB
VPVLARTLEAAGLSTVMVANMPFWAERIGMPRTLAVEFPFGHTLGQPHDVAQQMRVIRRALRVLEEADAPGAIVHAAETWPVPPKEAIADWQPEVPSPVIEVMAPRLREMLRQRRRPKGERPADKVVPDR